MKPGYATRYQVLRLRSSGTKNYQVVAQIDAVPSELRDAVEDYVAMHIGTIKHGGEVLLFRNMNQGSVTPYRVTVPPVHFQVERAEL